MSCMPLYGANGRARAWPRPTPARPNRIFPDMQSDPVFVGRFQSYRIGIAICLDPADETGKEYAHYTQLKLKSKQELRSSAV